MLCTLSWTTSRNENSFTWWIESSLDPDRLTERHLQNFLLEVARTKQIQNKFLRKLRNDFERAKSLPNGLSATCSWADVWTVSSSDSESFLMKIIVERCGLPRAVNEVWTFEWNSAANTDAEALTTKNCKLFQKHNLKCLKMLFEIFN